MHRPVPVLAIAAASLVPIAGAPLSAVAVASAGAHRATAGRLVAGATYRMKWGDVTVRLRLDSRGRRIVDVGSTLPTERRRSAQINGRAGPVLRSEVLRAQSSRIHAVSGATMTSDAYTLSLRSALHKAHL